MIGWFAGWVVGKKMNPTVLSRPKWSQSLSLVVRLIPHGGSLLVAQPFLTLNYGLPAGFLSEYILYLFAHSCILRLSFSGCMCTYLVSLYIALSFPWLLFLYSFHRNWALCSASWNCMGKGNHDFKLRINASFVSNTYDLYGLMPFLIGLSNLLYWYKNTLAR